MDKRDIKTIIGFIMYCAGWVMMLVSFFVCVVYSSEGGPLSQYGLVADVLTVTLIIVGFIVVFKGLTTWIRNDSRSLPKELKEPETIKPPSPPSDIWETLEIPRTPEKKDFLTKPWEQKALEA